MTPSPEYTDEHNAWVRQLPQTIRQLLFTVKRYYQPEWGNNWREHFTVDRINGFLGHELKFENQPLVSNYLRVGFDPGRLLAHLQAAAGFSSRRQSGGGRRHHRFGGVAAREPERSRSRISESQREAGGQLRAPSVPAAGRRDSPRRRSASRSRHREPGQFLFQLRSFRRRSRRARWWITWWSSTATPSR